MITHRMYIATLMSGILAVFAGCLGIAIVALVAIHLHNPWLGLVVPIGFTVASRIRRRVRMRPLRPRVVIPEGQERGD